MLCTQAAHSPKFLLQGVVSSMQGPILPNLAEMYQHSIGTVSLVISGYALGGFLGSLFCGEQVSVDVGATQLTWRSFGSRSGDEEDRERPLSVCLLAPHLRIPL